ncbi:MAG: hypothetical protein EVJ46_07265 [Candidatus Acididesulfobacter guangdongensis]|uniref:Sulfotransferase family protein n=1 Tax=Acididesulfobacter guangdongensis TaxID=2597225 RepID=A0A519BFF3_ACIG2|nr:MAG: hypothetical protein EVJ46_07265 [Candidatus Acididesulfobacter guangdongensis]
MNNERNGTEKRIIAVVGVPRSGTSAITKGLDALGIYIGKARYSPPDIGNEKGFFEDADINSLNYGLLKILTGKPDNAILINLKNIPDQAISIFKSAAKDILKERLGNTDIFGFKDPFIAKLLPIWQEIFNELKLNVSYVVACRNPKSSALSMVKRGNMDIIIAYYIWLSGMVSVLDCILNPMFMSSSDAVFVDYDDMLENPEAQLLKIALRLKLEIDNKNNPALKEYTADFLTNSMRHAAFTIEDLRIDKNIPPKVAEFYILLRKLCLEDFSITDSNVAREFTKIKIWLKELSSTIFFMQASYNTLLAMNEVLIDKENKIAELGKTIDALSEK